MDKYYLITFENASMAMMAEGKLREKGVNLRIMPTPTYIAKSCGISIRIDDMDGNRVNEYLLENLIAFKHYYLNDGISIKELM